MPGILWGKRSASISEFSILFFGPTVYLFTSSVLKEKKWNANDLFHYLPGVVYSLIITFYYLIPSSEVINARVASGELMRVVKILVGTGLVVNCTYFVLSVQQFFRLKKSLESEASYFVNIQFIKYFLSAIGLCLIAWTGVYFMSFGNNIMLEVDVRPVIWLAVALIVLMLTYYQMVSPNVFQFEPLVIEKKYTQSKLNKGDLDKLKMELEKVMELKKPYLNAKLLKSELAELMGINGPELSRLLNERIGMNFFEYINYHRIHEFIKLAQSPSVKEKTLLGLAQEAGFNSKTTFNKSFKKIMGCSPSDYLKKEI